MSNRALSDLTLAGRREGGSSLPPPPTAQVDAAPRLVVDPAAQGVFASQAGNVPPLGLNARPKVFV